MQPVKFRNALFIQKENEINEKKHLGRIVLNLIYVGVDFWSIGHPRSSPRQLGDMLAPKGGFREVLGALLAAPKLVKNIGKTVFFIKT